MSYPSRFSWTLVGIKSLLTLFSISLVFWYILDSEYRVLRLDWKSAEHSLARLGVCSHEALKCFSFIS